MDSIVKLIEQHQTTAALLLYYLVSNAISAMPTPSGGGFYRWLFDFAHLMAGNISRVVATRYPQVAAAPVPPPPPPVPNPEQGKPN